MRISDAALAAMAPDARSVWVTSHALDRGWERCRLTRGEIRRDVVAAFREGRTGHERPAWLGVGPTVRNGRYAWSHDETRAYVLRAGDSWCVTTILTPGEAA